AVQAVAGGVAGGDGDRGRAGRHSARRRLPQCRHQLQVDLRHHLLADVGHAVRAAGILHRLGRVPRVQDPHRGSRVAGGRRPDRRWIFLSMALRVHGALIRQLYRPLKVTEHSRAFGAPIDRIPHRSTVLMSCDYDPGAIPELVPMTRTAMRHLLSKDCKIVITVLWNAGPGLVDSVTREVAREFPGKRYGVDWINLGYKSGNEAVMVLMGQGI